MKYYAYLFLVLPTLINSTNLYLLKRQVQTVLSGDQNNLLHVVKQLSDESTFEDFVDGKTEQQAKIEKLLALTKSAESEIDRWWLTPIGGYLALTGAVLGMDIYNNNQTSSFFTQLVFPPMLFVGMLGAHAIETQKAYSEAREKLNGRLIIYQREEPFVVRGRGQANFSRK